MFFDKMLVIKKVRFVIMIVSFCGHSSFFNGDLYTRKVLDIFEQKIGDRQVEFYLGEYGAFDRFARVCAKEYKKKHPRASLVFVMPYLSGYSKERMEYINQDFDFTIYPEIENAIPKFAITYRNRWMMERADLVIAYVNRKYGGAYASYKHAKRKGKEIINLADFNE